jgi:hypothetical protein
VDVEVEFAVEYFAGIAVAVILEALNISLQFGAKYEVNTSYLTLL